MRDCHEPVPEAEDAGDRDAAVIAAIGRIGSSLDLDTAVREVVDGTGAVLSFRSGCLQRSGAAESGWLGYESPVNFESLNHAA